jgi:mono/diheme cytochrome c family protein
MRRTLLFIPLGALAIVVFAEDSWELPLNEPQLRPGPGVEVVATNCQICHSADYLSTQPPLSRAAWTATVQKMREKYGAPLATNQVEQIVQYLVTTYGKK